MRTMKKKKTKSTPFLKGSVAQGAKAAEVLGSHSRYPLPPCPQLRGLWDHWSLAEEADLNSLEGWKTKQHYYLTTNS